MDASERFRGARSVVDCLEYLPRILRPARISGDSVGVHDGFNFFRSKLPVSVTGRNPKPVLIVVAVSCNVCVVFQIVSLVFTVEPLPSYWYIWVSARQKDDNQIVLTDGSETSCRAIVLHVSTIGCEDAEIDYGRIVQ